MSQKELITGRSKTGRVREIFWWPLYTLMMMILLLIDIVIHYTGCPEKVPPLIEFLV